MTCHEVFSVDGAVKHGQEQASASKSACLAALIHKTGPRHPRTVKTPMGHPAFLFHC